MKNKVIIFFTRIPTLGKTKTRLEPFLNKNLCMELQAVFIKDIYNNIKNMGIDIIVCYSEHGDLSDLKDIIQEDVFFLKQKGEGLGDKMYNAISYALKKYDKSVLIGSDIPLINEEDIKTAFKILETKDLAISPSYDGGYYLIGMKEEIKDVFDIKYSTNSVFEETISKIKSIGKTFGKGNVQLDVDNKDDFFKLYNILEENNNITCNNTRKFLEKIIKMKKCDNNE